MSDHMRSLAITDILPVMDPSLLSAICEAPIDPELQSTVASSPRVRTRIAARVAADLDIPATIKATDSAAVDTLIFASEQDLDQLLICAAGLAASDAIRRTVEKDAVTKLRDIFGDSIYALILGFDPPFQIASTPPISKTDARSAGLSYLADWLSYVPAPLDALIHLRFDQSDKDALEKVAIADGQRVIDTAADLLATTEVSDA